MLNDIEIEYESTPGKWVLSALSGISGCDNLLTPGGLLESVKCKTDNELVYRRVPKDPLLKAIVLAQNRAIVDIQNLAAAQKVMVVTQLFYVEVYFKRWFSNHLLFFGGFKKAFFQFLGIYHQFGLVQLNHPT